MPRYKKIIAENRKAFFDFDISETVEAGIVLRGSEVKSIRRGSINLKDSFARPEKGEMMLYGMHVSPYKFAGKDDMNPLRTRKLLLKRTEIKKLAGRATEKGLSIIPLKIYFLGNYAKIELGIAKGKRLYDKKEKIKRRDLDRDMGRELVDRNNRDKTRG
ncbi:MAG: SsrA-binding protein SmpB [Candidatus Saganbacteria bacterium]|nr:SsrA-binding protein SmpB [Candidatus Saganbacteria bacterium]